MEPQWIFGTIKKSQDLCHIWTGLRTFECKASSRTLEKEGGLSKENSSQ